MRIFGVICLLFFGLWAYARWSNSVELDQNVTGRLKRAADANTVEIAQRELLSVIQYASLHGLTKGSTHVFYATPDEDVAYWYANLCAAANELQRVSPEATQMERTNVLMKLRETLMDGEKVTVPPGLAVYPNNFEYGCWGILACIAGFIGLGMLFGDNRYNRY